MLNLWIQQHGRVICFRTAQPFPYSIVDSVHRRRKQDKDTTQRRAMLAVARVSDPTPIAWCENHSWKKLGLPNDDSADAEDWPASREPDGEFLSLLRMRIPPDRPPSVPMLMLLHRLVAQTVCMEESRAASDL